MTVNDVIIVLERLAPPQYAADWDNVGLLIGSRQWDAQRIMLTIDLTGAVMGEAVDAEIDMIIAYHPTIFAPLKSLTDDTEKSRLVLEAVRAGMAVYSPHTALDAAPGGVNDWLAEGLVGSASGGDIRALDPQASLPESEECKIVTFCPADAAERIRNGLASIGAGQKIGRASCRERVYVLV